MAPRTGQDLYERWSARAYAQSLSGWKPARWTALLDCERAAWNSLAQDLRR